MSDTGGLGGDPCGDLGLDGNRPRRPFKESVRTTSFTMPTCRHFWNRQNWQRFRRRLSTGQFLSARHTYLDPFCTVLLKNPTKKNNDVRIVILNVSVRCSVYGDPSQPPNGSRNLTVQSTVSCPFNAFHVYYIAWTNSLWWPIVVYCSEEAYSNSNWFFIHSLNSQTY